jgi:hypothetical protein
VIGTNLNLSLPLAGDTMSSVVAKTAAALSAIQTSIADKATPAALNINAPLSLNGNALTQVTSLQLASGNANGTPGSIFYQAGEFWAVDSTGTAIQLTAGGSINIGGTGGFVGDYVASNPTGAAYNLASGQFRFTKSAGVWADLAFANAVLQGANGTVSLGVDAAVNTARTLNVKSLPTSGISLLVYNGATSTLEDAAVTSPTNPVPTMTVGTLTVTGDTKKTYSDRFIVPLNPSASGTNVNVSASAVSSTNTAWAYDTSMIPSLIQGDRIKTISVWSTVGGGTVTAALKKFDAAAGTVTTIESWSVTLPTSSFTSHTLTSPPTVAAGERYYLSFSAGSASGAWITGIEGLKDHP